jgi:hypothetical protein
VILNISQLQAGKMTAQHAETLQALQQMTSSHQVPYTFDGGISIPFEADVRVVVISTALTHKLLPCTLQVRCTPNNLTSAAAGKLLEHEVLALRHHLAVARRDVTQVGSNVRLPRQLLDRAQADFLERRNVGRQQQQTLVGEHDFHRWLTLTRLNARGRHASEADVQDWQRALELDDVMMATLAV